jgi:hypothetical protein
MFATYSLLFLVLHTFRCFSTMAPRFTSALLTRSHDLLAAPRVETAVVSTFNIIVGTSRRSSEATTTTTTAALDSLSLPLYYSTSLSQSYYAIFGLYTHPSSCSQGSLSAIAMLGGAKVVCK